MDSESRRSMLIFGRLMALRAQLIKLLELRGCCGTSSELRSIALIVRRKRRVEGMLWELKHFGEEGQRFDSMTCEELRSCCEKAHGNSIRPFKKVQGRWIHKSRTEMFFELEQTHGLLPTNVKKPVEERRFDSMTYEELKVCCG